MVRRESGRDDFSRIGDRQAHDMGRCAPGGRDMERYWTGRGHSYGSHLVPVRSRRILCCSLGLRCIYGIRFIYAHV
ncbi:UNVERIFIED_CONTAM: hypothetical protein NCL1_24976 [Trichonephila clavipes]